MVRSVVGLLRSVARRGEDTSQDLPDREVCLLCGGGLLDSDLFAQLRVCPVCRFHYSMPARERIESIADPGSFREINRTVTSLDPLSFSSRVPYKQRLFQDQRRTGLTEAAVTGTCTIGGSATVVIVLDFGFMGGSMGSVVGEKVALALEHATKRKRPVVAVVTSGGVRVQEGVFSLMQMAKTAIAVNLLNAKGLPFITILANPASGQVYASFSNLADIIMAEPGAIVGLAPMRTIKESSEQPLPGGSHTAESHLEHGMLDAVVDRERLREHIAVLLDLLGPQFQLTTKSKALKQEVKTVRSEAWHSVKLARHGSRPTSLDYIGQIVVDFVEIHGDRVYGDDGAVVCGLGRLGGQTVAIVGQERGRTDDSVRRNDGRMSPEGFRKTQRTFHMAAKFGIPIITFVDTPGPFLSLAAEERGLGNAIATTMSLMGDLDVPTISAVIGEGGSEGALALAVADRVLMMENAIYSVISPEEAAGLIYGDEGRAQEVAESLRMTARDCAELGIVDSVVQEPPGGAHANPDEAARQLRRVLMRSLAEIQSVSNRKRMSERYKKYRNIGRYGSHYRAAIRREVDALQGLVATGMKRISGRSEPTTEEALPEVPVDEPNHECGSGS